MTLDLHSRLETLVPGLRRHARALVGERERADDLVQACLEQVLAAAADGASISDLRTTAFATLHDLCMRDAQWRRSISEAPDFHWAATKAGELYLRTQAERGELSRIARAMESLTTEQRQALALVAVEGFAYPEAAKSLGIGVEELVQHLSAARAALRSRPKAPARLRRVK